MSPRQVDHHGNRFPAPEGASHTRNYLFWPGVPADTHRSRWSPVQTTHVVEVYAETTTTICQGIGRNGLDRGPNGGLGGWPTPGLRGQSCFLLMGLHLGCGVTVQKIWRPAWKTVTEIKQLKEDRSYSPPIWTNIIAIKSKCCPAQERGCKRYTKQRPLWRFFCDCGEDMRKLNGKPTTMLEEQVHELQGKTGGSPRRVLLQSPVGSSPDGLGGFLIFS